jgi:hypothetical protein
MTDNTVNTDAEYIYNFDNFFAISADFICIAGFDGCTKINPAVSEAVLRRELYARPISSFVYEPDKSHNRN